MLAAKFGGDGNPLGIGHLGVALAFGLTVLTGAYAFGHISGGHFNPAVSLGLWAGGRFPARDLPGYIVAQVLGGIAAAALLYFIASGNGTVIGQAVVGDPATLRVPSPPTATAVCRPAAMRWARPWSAKS